VLGAGCWVLVAPAACRLRGSMSHGRWSMVDGDRGGMVDGRWSMGEPNAEHRTSNVERRAERGSWWRHKLDAIVKGVSGPRSGLGTHHGGTEATEGEEDTEGGSETNVQRSMFNVQLRTGSGTKVFSEVSRFVLSKWGAKWASYMGDDE
jgi:hypothetical protein